MVGTESPTLPTPPPTLSTPPTLPPQPQLPAEASPSVTSAPPPLKRLPVLQAQPSPSLTLGPHTDPARLAGVSHLSTLSLQKASPLSQSSATASRWGRLGSGPPSSLVQPTALASATGARGLARARHAPFMNPRPRWQTRPRLRGSAWSRALPQPPADALAVPGGAGQPERASSGCHENCACCRLLTLGAWRK